jgi:DNA mismatch endonuclease (patch repair protein)
MDHLTPAERSQLMSRVRSKDTAPERLVRSLIHRLGYRYRLHVRDLPGRPDLVFPRFRAVVLVHGCFWHQHHCPAGDRIPKSRVAYWRDKLEGNVRRDARQRRELKRLGWRVLVIWECESRRHSPERLARRIIRFLEATRRSSAARKSPKKSISSPEKSLT